MALRLAGALAAFLLAGSCQFPGTTPSCSTVMIDWINFIQVGQTQYVAGPQNVEAVKEADLAAVYTHVKFKVAGNVCDPNYRPKDGDAAFLEAGTPVYQIKGYSSTDRLAALFNGSYAIYKPFLAIQARSAAVTSLPGR